MGTFWLTIATLIALSQTSPISTKIKHDQRQEGKWNIRADFENFVIVVIPASSYKQGSSYNSSVLSLLSKAFPIPYINKGKEIPEEERRDISDSEEFIESKTAPYHVDIGRSKGHLAKLYPEVGVSDSIIAKSPSVNLEKSEHQHHKKHPRGARAFLITVPVENEYLSRGDMKNAIDSKTEDVLKKSIGLSIEAINNGLTDQLKEHHVKKNGELIEPNIKIIKLSENGDSNNLEKLDEAIKNDTNVSHAVLLAKAIKNVLLEYFKKVAETIKTEADKNNIELSLPDDAPQDEVKYEDGKKSEVNKKHDKKESIKITKEDKETKIKNKDNDKKEEHKIISKGNLEFHKDELLLLGADNEQCGPGQERDAAGICIASVKS